ncbi:MAG: hypothetical protein K6F47_05100 [Bacteroidaceae bacterium]|nr:hypothetical protein [Bacteroidaceae bacterium]
MFDAYINNLYLSFWTGDKKIGPQKNIILSRRCETFGDMVYDLRWTIKYLQENGKTSPSVSITERANKWDLRKVIRRVEKTALKQRIKELVAENESSNSVK